MLTRTAHRQTVSDPLRHPFVEERGFFLDGGLDSISDPVIFAKVETSQIRAPMDRYESRMKLDQSDCIRSSVFILTAAGVELVKL